MGYGDISTSSRVDCGTNTIELIPDSNNTNILPIYRYNNQTKALSFSFKGVTGVDLTKCLNLVCDTNLGNFITTNDEFRSIKAEVNENVDDDKLNIKFLVKETENNILCERTFRSLENLYNSVDSEYRAVSFSPILKSAMTQAYEIIEENKKK